MCQCLQNLLQLVLKTMEGALHPGLVISRRVLLLQVSTGNLERVRRIKNRLVRLTTRVQTLREMLEKLMDDDSDMHAMHLTARAYDQLERQVSFRPCLCPMHVGCVRHTSCLMGKSLQTMTTAQHRRKHAYWGPVQPLELECLVKRALP